MPGAEEAADGDELAQVVCVVIGDQEGFAEDRVGRLLGLGVADWFEEIDRGVRDQIHHRLKVGPECGDGLVPGCGARRRVGGGPVAVGELGGGVLWVDAVAENIPLGDSHVLDQTPGSVGKTWGFLAAKLGWQAGDRLFEIEVAVTAFQQLDEVLSQGDIRLHGGYPCATDSLSEGSSLNAGTPDVQPLVLHFREYHDGMVAAMGSLRVKGVSDAQFTTGLYNLVKRVDCCKGVPGRPSGTVMKQRIASPPKASPSMATLSGRRTTMPRLLDSGIDRGRFLTADDDAKYENYAVLGAGAARPSSSRQTRLGKRSSAEQIITRSWA